MFFFNGTATTEIYTLSLHDALPISGAERSSAWICDFSSTQNTTAASGELRYRPTMSRTLSMNCGSGESLNASVWCGLSPNARQIRLTAVWLIPVAAAIDRVDQCVAFAG